MNRPAPSPAPGPAPRPKPNRFRFSYGQKIFLLATLPLMAAVIAIALVVGAQSRLTAKREIAELEVLLLSAKKEELKNYLSLARTAFSATYGNALPDDEAAKLKVTQTLAAMLYGQEGYFFVYDYDGNNLVAPRQTDLIGENWIDLRDPDGTPVVAELIDIAKTGAGYHSFIWPKPTTGENAQMVAYVIGLQDWRWAVGTGIFIDDVLTSVAATRAHVEARVRRTFVYIGAITLAALLGVFGSGMFINVRERRLADARLKVLTQRIFDTQEEERGRVARELHDSISQILVGVRYTLELARRRVATKDDRAGENLEKGIGSLNGAIQEVRRISRDLRPGVLDDLGLGPAIKALAAEFAARTGIETDVETVVFRNRLDQEAKIALYRVAQEALTNIERHAGATHVSIRLFGHKKGATLRIEDNGIGMAMGAARRADPGIGLRNMQERVEQLEGHFTLRSQRAEGMAPEAPTGTLIEVQVPLSHILPPVQQQQKTGTPEH